MINEVYVIQTSGIPLYYYNYDQIVSKTQINDDFYTLQAGFFAALVQFGSELAKDELRYVIFDNKTYAIKRSNDLYVVFSENIQLSVDQLKELDKKLESASLFISEKLDDSEVDVSFAVNRIQIEQIVGSFSDYLYKEKIIEKEEVLDKTVLKNQVQKFVFKAVGYEPGKCNIGQRERMLRLTMGMVSLIIGLAYFALAALFPLIPEWTIFFTFIPFSIGFIGIYQSFFRFCVSNAFRKVYNMN